MTYELKADIGTYQDDTGQTIEVDHQLDKIIRQADGRCIGFVARVKNAPICLTAPVGKADQEAIAQLVRDRPCDKGTDQSTVKPPVMVDGPAKPAE